jgi:hypothetical protein
MGLALLSLCAVLGSGPNAEHTPLQVQVDPAEAVAAELRAGRFAEALRLTGEVREPALAARLEAEVRWTAGDLDGALAAAREGLVAVPSDARLASTAADLALTLGLLQEARRHLAALDGALGEASWAEATSAETQRWWRERRAGLEALAVEAETGLAARDRALFRSRTVGGGFLALASAVCGWLLLVPGTRRGAARPRLPHP